MSEDIKIMVVNESDAKSIASDIFSMGAILFSYWLGYRFMGNPIMLQMLLFIIALLTLIGRSSSKVKRMTAIEGRDYLNAKFPR